MKTIRVKTRSGKLTLRLLETEQRLFRRDPERQGSPRARPSLEPTPTM